MLALVAGLLLLMIITVLTFFSAKARAELYPAATPFGLGVSINLSPPPAAQPQVRMLRLKVLRPTPLPKPRRPAFTPVNFNPHGLY